MKPSPQINTSHGVHISAALPCTRFPRIKCACLLCEAFPLGLPKLSTSFPYPSHPQTIKEVLLMNQKQKKGRKRGKDAESHFMAGFFGLLVGGFFANKKLLCQK